MKLLLSNSSRYSTVRVFALDSYIRPRRGEKKKYSLLLGVRQNFPRLKLPLSSGSCGQFSLQTSRHTRVRGSDIRAELNGDLRAVGVPRHFFLAFFPTSLVSRATHDRPDFKVPIRGGWKRRESKEEYSISLDSCHGHVPDAREQ